MYILPLHYHVIYGGVAEVAYYASEGLLLQLDVPRCIPKCMYSDHLLLFQGERISITSIVLCFAWHTSNDYSPAYSYTTILSITMSMDMHYSMHLAVQEPVCTYYALGVRCRAVGSGVAGCPTFEGEGGVAPDTSSHTGRCTGTQNTGPNIFALRVETFSTAARSQHCG